MEKVLEKDISIIRSASNVTLNQSGTKAVFLDKVGDHKGTGYLRNLYLVDMETEKTIQLTSRGDIISFIWDDEDTLLVQRKNSDGQKGSTFERLYINGGEAVSAFHVDLDVTEIQKSTEGNYVLLALTDWNAKEEKDPLDEGIHVIEEVPVWSNGASFVSGIRSTLFLYDESKKTTKRITGKYVNVHTYCANETYIVYTGKTQKDLITDPDFLNIYNFETKKTKTLIKQKEYKIQDLAFDGQTIIYSASDMKPFGEGQNVDLYQMDLEGNSSMIWKNQGQEIGASPISDVMTGGGYHLKLIQGKVFFTALHKFENDLYTLQYGKESLVTKNSIVTCFDTDGETIILIGAEQCGLSEVYVCKNKELKSIYNCNSSYLETHFISKPERLTFIDHDGIEIDGWVMKPYGFEEGKKYPGILEIHGGPRCSSSDPFFHEYQMLASQGYFVFYSNPRGSAGYGDAFADLRNQYGTIDYDDLMQFTDVVLETYPELDANALGACGGSYGGFMCNWIEGHTDRFGAIASQRSISNWIADFGSSEIGVLFDSNEMQATPWKNIENMWRASPLQYAKNAKTPILFIHSLNDYNCPLDQGVEMFTAMKYFKVPSKMVLFENENHNLSRTGQPNHRIRRLLEIRQWFDTYLKKGR